MSLDTDELADRFPSYQMVSTLISDEHASVTAVGHLLILKLLNEAPDLLQLAVQRLTDEYRQTVFDGGDLVV